MNFEFRFSINTLNLLIFANILFFIAGFVLLGLNFVEPVYLMILSTENVRNGIFFQLMTFNFFHIDALHLFFNVFGLYSVGRIVSEFYDSKKLFLVYIFGGVSAGLLSVIGSYLQSFNFLTLGASGAIFALCGLILGGKLKRNRFGVDLPVDNYFLVSYMGVGLLLGFIPGLNINNWAHFGGLIFGIVVGLLFNNSLSKQSKRDNMLSNFLYLSSICIVIISIISFGWLLLSILSN